MFSISVKHLTSTGKFLTSRSMGSSTGRIKPVIKHYDIAISYTIDETNGNVPTVISANFPSGKYEALNYTPSWDHHLFAGWFDSSAAPTISVPVGTKIKPNDNIVYNRSVVYARWQIPVTITFDATTNGGQMPSGWVSPDYYEGQPYGTLPQPTKSGEVFLGWFTSGGTRVTESSTVTTGTLTARYMEVVYDTSFEVTTASSYRKAGIYSTTALNSSKPTVVDWGDGTTDVVYGNISQLVHTYSSNGTFTMRVNDSISSIALSTNNSTWYSTTTNNSTSIRKILALSANITSLPSYAFYHCQQIRDVVLSPGSSNLTLGTYAFSYCFYQSSAVGTIDLSPRKINLIPNYCFYYCRYLKGITWPQELKSIGGSAFRYCFYYASSTGTVEIPEGVTSISGIYAFYGCSYLTAVTLPSTLTNLNNYTFSVCTRLVTITSNRSTAPTVSSYTFGSNTSSYTGRTAYSAGTNKLYVPAGATGYNASYWSSVLLDSTKCGFTLEEMASGKTLPVTIVGSGYGGNTSYSMTIDDVGGTLTITNMYGNYSFADASNWRIMDFRATSTTESFVIMETATNSNIVVGLKTYGCSEDFVGYSGAIIDSADFEP